MPRCTAAFNPTQTPPEALTWDYRFPRLIEEIVEGRCDIVCLQEANHFGAHGPCPPAPVRGIGARQAWRSSAALHRRAACIYVASQRWQPGRAPHPEPPLARRRAADEIAAALQPHGLAGFFLPKHPAPPERFGCPPDGTALFYRASRLAPVDGPRGAPYQRLPSGGGGASKGGKADGGGPMTQGYVIATLRDVASGRLLVAAATHLKAKDGGPNDETRRIQVGQLMAVLCDITACICQGCVQVITAVSCCCRLVLHLCLVRARPAGAAAARGGRVRAASGRLF